MKSNHNIKIFPPEGYEIDKASIIDNTAVVTFKKINKKLPKTWEEFCAFYPLTSDDCYISKDSSIFSARVIKSHTERQRGSDRNLLPDYATAEAVLALCQIIQLQNCYNGDWVPDWKNYSQVKYYICFNGNTITKGQGRMFNEMLHFKTAELRDEFLCNFRPLIEKLKPLYGIKEGGQE